MNSNLFNELKNNMTIQDTINSDLKIAMMTKNEEVKSLLRVIIGEFNRIDKVVTNEEATRVIKKMVQNATDQNNQAELVILFKYLPQQLTGSELGMAISEIIKNNNYSSMKDMGKVMTNLKLAYAGRYDGKLANELTKAVFDQK